MNIQTLRTTFTRVDSAALKNLLVHDPDRSDWAVDTGPAMLRSTEYPDEWCTGICYECETAVAAEAQAMGIENLSEDADRVSIG